MKILFLGVLLLTASCVSNSVHRNVATKRSSASTTLTSLNIDNAQLESSKGLQVLGIIPRNSPFNGEALKSPYQTVESMQWANYAGNSDNFYGIFNLLITLADGERFSMQTRLHYNDSDYSDRFKRPNEKSRFHWDMLEDGYTLLAYKGSGCVSKIEQFLYDLSIGAVEENFANRFFQSILDIKADKRPNTMFFNVYFKKTNVRGEPQLYKAGLYENHEGVEYSQITGARSCNPRTLVSGFVRRMKKTQ